MIKLKLCLFTIFLALFGSKCLAQNLELYKQIDTTALFLEVHYPENFNKTINHSAMIFFFGGGWKGGNRKQFLKHAEYFAQRGMVCFLADYRIENKNHTTPFESLIDAKSAIRFIRQNASKYAIDTTKIIALGGSAGGHLAAATAVISDFNDPEDDLSISCIPNALVLFNPVIDNGPGGYGYDRIGAAYKQFSPLHNIKKGAPPTLFFLGTKDALIPVETAAYYKVIMNEIGSRCELKLYKGQAHGFFNYSNLKYYKKTVRETNQFLQSIGFLTKESKLKIE